MPVALYQEKCPHCSCGPAYFEFQWGTPPRSGQNPPLAVFRCPGCRHGVLAEALANDRGVDLSQQTGTLRDVWGMHRVFPFPKEPKIPRHLPKTVETLFREGCFTAHRAPTASCMALRKALEESLKIIDPSSGGNLKKRIENAAAKNLITQALSDWAHEVRVIGNDAAHETELRTREEAEELRDFVDLYLQYVHTMPGILQERREKKQ